MSTIYINQVYNIYICKTKNAIFFPGGHKEKNESRKKSLIRELKEELGINISYKDINRKVLKIISYDKDYPLQGSNSIDTTYYYLINNGYILNNNNRKLTKEEISKNFEVLEVNKNKVIDYLNDNLNKTFLNKIIIPDMLTALKFFIVNKK